MDLFTTIFWWFGVTLFTVSATLFYGLLSYTIFKDIKEALAKK